MDAAAARILLIGWFPATILEATNFQQLYIGGEQTKHPRQNSLN